MKKIISIFLLGFINCAFATGQADDKVAKEEQAAKSHVSLGVTYYTSAKYNIAKEEATVALQIKKDYAPAYNLLGIIAFAEHDLNKAKEYYSKALSLMPTNGDINNNYAILLCDSGKYKESIEYFGKAMLDESYLNTEMTLNNAGICLFKDGDIAASTKFFEGAVKLNNQNPIPIFYLAKIANQQNRPQEAITLIERVHAITSPTAESYYFAASMYKKIGKTEDYEEFKNKLIRDFPDSEETKKISH